MSSAADLIDRYYERLSAGDVDAVVAMYADDAEIVRSGGISQTRDDIRGYHESQLRRHPDMKLREIVDVVASDDVLVADALVDTDHGVAQFRDVIVFTDDGLFRVHVPGLRGYWGG